MISILDTGSTFGGNKDICDGKNSFKTNTNTEMTLLESYAVSTTSVIADSDDVSVYCIPFKEIQKLFDVEAGLYGRFYHRVADVLCHSLQQKQKLTGTMKKSLRTAVSGIVRIKK